MTRRTVPLSPLTRIPDHSTDYLDALDVEVVSETETFTPSQHGPPSVYVPPVGWVPVSPYERTPIFDALEAEWQWRTVKGRKSRLDLSFDGFVAASRAQHGTYRRGAQ